MVTPAKLFLAIIACAADARPDPRDGVHPGRHAQVLLGSAQRDGGRGPPPAVARAVVMRQHGAHDRPPDSPWWRDAVVYQIYPRSFQDSDGDGEGDLRGIAQRLDHIATLGADALWLSPIYPSPMADGGYDVTDYDGRRPALRHARRRSTRSSPPRTSAACGCCMDVVPCHTSIEHPWFREHPDCYVWSDRDGPPNNWIASFGGPAWSRDRAAGRWYLHSFYPEQPDLDWRNPEVREAMARRAALLARARRRRLPPRRDRPPAEGPASCATTRRRPGRRRCPSTPTHGDARARATRATRRTSAIALAALREGAGDDAFLVGEVYLPAARLAPYLEHLDVAFAFELLPRAVGRRGGARARSRRARPAGAAGRVAWVLSNHDFPRLPDRVGRAQRARRGAARAHAARAGVRLPGRRDRDGRRPAAATPPDDRAGRDPFRHPMRWDDDAPHGGFTTRRRRGCRRSPSPAAASPQQARDPDSVLRALPRPDRAAPRRCAAGLEFARRRADGVLAYRRGDDHVVALNLGDEPRARAAGRDASCAHTHGAAAGRGAAHGLRPGRGSGDRDRRFATSG